MSLLSETGILKMSFKSKVESGFGIVPCSYTMSQLRTESLQLINLFCIWYGW